MRWRKLILRESWSLALRYLCCPRQVGRTDHIGLVGALVTVRGIRGKGSFPEKLWVPSKRAGEQLPNSAAAVVFKLSCASPSEVSVGDDRLDVSADKPHTKP